MSERIKNRKTSGADVGRPSDLPDFRDPPLNEVVLGVQFAPAKGYSQIRASEVWALFKSAFPEVEEQPPLPPSFEVFGLPQATQMNLGFITGPRHDRFWFLAPSGDELIQFQHDRLLHNWRKVGDGSNQYPRFERMIESFRAELGALEGYFTSLAPQSLVINQCEISYINNIPWDDGPVDAWLKFLHFQGETPDDFTAAFRRVLPGAEGQPNSRLICEAVTAFVSTQRIIRLTLSVRGAPAQTDVPTALEFLTRGRDVMVRTFAEITTESAHKKWQRIQ
jgi:uncharacterized protein (TIGR04255 family)